MYTIVKENKKKTAAVSRNINHSPHVIVCACYGAFIRGERAGATFPSCTDASFPPPREIPLALPTAEKATPPQIRRSTAKKKHKKKHARHNRCPFAFTTPRKAGVRSPPPSLAKRRPPGGAAQRA